VLERFRADTPPREENPSKQKFRAGFDSIKAGFGRFPVMPLDLLQEISIIQPAKLGHDHML
jgi:hypothetical protein